MQIQGTVVHGKEAARALGYPTANIQHHSTEQLTPGVWTCWIFVNGLKYKGLAVVGMWQLESGAPSVEVHVLEFSQDIYDQTVDVMFGELLRALEKFESMEKLKLQIQADVANASAWFTTH